MFVSRALRLLLPVAVVAAFGCAADNGEDATVPIAIAVSTPPPDVVSVEYLVNCDGGFTATGELEIVPDRDPPVWGTVVNVPAGACGVALTAFDADGNAACAGSTMVDVVEGETAKANILLTCGDEGEGEGSVSIDGTFESCSLNINHLNAIPSSVSQGGMTTVQVLATDSAGGAVTTTLSANKGSLADPSAAQTVYTCPSGEDTTATITAVAENDVCSRTEDLQVTCGSGSNDRARFPSFVRYAGDIKLFFQQTGTNLCLDAPGDELVLAECDDDPNGTQVWTVRKNFALEHAASNRCVARLRDGAIRLAACLASDEFRWWVSRRLDTTDRYEIRRFVAMSECVGTDGDSLRTTDCDAPNAASFGFKIPLDLVARGGGLLPPDSGTLQNIREIAPEGFGNIDNKYAWSITQLGDDILVGTLNALTERDVYEFTESVPIQSEGAEVWRGTTSDGGQTWSWAPEFTEGLFSKDNFGIRKLINCRGQVLAVYMNSADGFGMLRYDGADWTVEFKDGGPEGLADPKNISGRGMAVFKDHVYLGVANPSTSAKLWRRAIDSSCEWASGSEWDVITDNGFGVDGNGFNSVNKNDWFGEVVPFGDHVYTGTLNYDGAQIWRSRTGDPGTANWERVYDAPIIGPNRNVNVIRLSVFQDHILGGTQNQEDGAELLISPSGDPGSWTTPFERGMTGDRRNTYLWYMVPAFKRLYTFFGSDFPNYHSFSIADITEANFETESPNGFNAERLYYGGRTALAWTPTGQTDNALLIMGTATPNTDQALRLYAADDNPDRTLQVIPKQGLPTTQGPAECISTAANQFGVLLNNGKVWAEFESAGSLKLLAVNDTLFSTRSDGVTNRNLCFQADGNLVVTNDSGRALWESGTEGTGDTLQLTDDCALEIRDASGSTVWSTNTSCP